MRIPSRDRRVGLTAVLLLSLCMIPVPIAADAPPSTGAACLVPELGIRICDRPGLIALQTASVSRGDMLLSVTTLFSGGGETVVHVEFTGLPPAIDVSQIRVVLGDTTPGEYQTRRGSSSGGGMSNNSTQTYRAEWVYEPLLPDVRTAEVRVQAPPPIGAWSLPIPVVPVADAHLPLAAPVASSATVRGITVSVTHAVTSGNQTAFALTAQGQPPAQIVRSLGDSFHLSRMLMLHDDRGQTYAELSTQGSTWPDLDGIFTDEALFPSLAPDTQSVTLDIPYVTVQEGGTATVQVPVAGLLPPPTGGREGDPHALDLPVTFGTDTFRITGVRIITEGGQAKLALDVDLGNWQNGRMLVSSGSPQVNAQATGYNATQHEARGVRQDTQLRVPLPTELGEAVTVTFTGPTVAVQGPWQLAVPVLP